jgi:predicted nucleic acid-binding protein
VSVALDTMILIWGQVHPGSRRGNPRQRDLVDLQTRSLFLLDMLQEAEETVIVPTVTVSELLLGVEMERHDSFLIEIQERFFCPTFDLRAAAMAARLWQSHRKLPKDQQLQRTVLRADVMILATAKVAGAVRFYSHEAKVRRLAEQVGLEALDLPDRHPDMHVDADIRKQTGWQPPE